MRENPVHASLFESAKIFVGILLALVIEPFLGSISKEVPSWVWFGASGAISALLLGTLYFFLFWKAVINLAWTLENDPDPQVQLPADLTTATKETAHRARVEARLVQARGLGGFALKLAMKRGLTAEVKFQHSQLGVIVEDSDLDVNSIPYTRRTVTKSGFTMDLPEPPATTSWGRAFIRFRGQAVASRTTDIKYSIRVGGPRSIARVCEMLIEVDSRAVALRERWS